MLEKKNNQPKSNTEKKKCKGRERRMEERKQVKETENFSTRKWRWLLNYDNSKYQFGIQLHKF